VSGAQPGPPRQIRGIPGVATRSPAIAKRQKHPALRRLYPVCRNTTITTLDLPSPGKGTFVLLQATFDPSGRACFTALGAPGKPAEQVVDEAVDELLGFLKTDGCVDQYLADQLLLPLLVVPGDATFRTSKITPHLLTNAHMIHQFFPNRITIDGDLNAPGTVKIRGGLKPSHYQGN
jgi:RNA 3'-terminal phosphate cyclase (ATP)